MAAMVDYPLIPAPTMIELLDFEAILQQMKDELVLRDPALAVVLGLESEPILKLFQIFAYRELGIRQRVNDAGHATMPAYATATDLDNIAAFYGVTRLLITAANPLAIPPTLDVMENDTALRERMRLAIYSRTTAGPKNQYRFIALSADSDVLDASVTSPAPGGVVISVLSRTGGGVPSATVLNTVAAVATADDVRPLTDFVQVQAARLVHYHVTALLTVYPGPDSAAVVQAATNRVTKWCALRHKIGNDITRSGLIAALSAEGVQNVQLNFPAADLVIDETSAPVADLINVSLSGVAV